MQLPNNYNLGGTHMASEILSITAEKMQVCDWGHVPVYTVMPC